MLAALLILSAIYYIFSFREGFNTEIVVKVEFDGKPYTIRRIVRCELKQTSGAWGDKAYGYFPEFMSFGIKTASGEGVIVTTPAVCSELKRRPKSILDTWVFDVPPQHIPLLSVADNADNPNQITVYASRQAYKSPKARLAFKSLNLQSPQLWNRFSFAVDSRDQFSFFGSMYEFENDVAYEHGKLKDKNDVTYQRGKPKKEYIRWLHMTFVSIPKEIWNDARKLRLSDGARRKLAVDYSVDEVVSLGRRLEIEDPSIFSEQRFSPRLPLYGYGIFPGPLLDGKECKVISCQMYLDEMVPYVQRANVWIPDLSNKGRFIVFNPDTVKDNALPSNNRSAAGRSVFTTQRVEFGNANYDYLSDIYSQESGNTVYIPKLRSLFHPVRWDFRFLTESLGAQNG